MEETIAKIPHRAHVPGGTPAGSHTPAAGVAATIAAPQSKKHDGVRQRDDGAFGSARMEIRPC